MKWVKTKQKLDKSDWHLHFALKPVVVQVYPDGNEKKAWLTTVLRRYVLNPGKPGIGIGPYWKPEYKERPEKEIPWNHESRLPDCERDVFPIPFHTSTLTPHTTGIAFSLSGEICESNVPDKPTYIPPPEPEVGWKDFSRELPDRRPEVEIRVCYSCQEDKHLSEFRKCPDGEVCDSCWDRIEAECTHDNGVTEKFGGNVCNDCDTVVSYGKIQEEETCEECGKTLPEIGMCPYCIEELEDNPKHEIDTAWEVKNAKRNKTIM